MAAPPASTARIASDIIEPAADAPAAALQAPATHASREPSSRMTVVMTCELDEHSYDVADELQMCIDQVPPSARLEIPRGVYTLQRQVKISKPITVRTAGISEDTCASRPDACANLLAGEALHEDYGLLLIHATGYVSLEHVVLDGNRDGRQSSRAALACRAGHNAAGFTASVVACADCLLRDVVARNALCGTGMFWGGERATIESSDFRDNGEPLRGWWADGLTAVYAPDSVIRGNRFLENTDVGLILGYAPRTWVEGNTIRQRDRPAFAGLMLDNFNSDNLKIRGDFRGAGITNNLIDCRQFNCVFGIQVGPRPWYPTRNIVGGKIWNNQIDGAKVGINVDGAGTAEAPVVIFSNRVTDVAEGAYFVSCEEPLPVGWMNISPMSLVDRGDEVRQTEAYLTVPCQLWSPVGTGDWMARAD